MLRCLVKKFETHLENAVHFQRPPMAFLSRPLEISIGYPSIFVTLKARWIFFFSKFYPHNCSYSFFNPPADLGFAESRLLSMVIEGCGFLRQDLEGRRPGEIWQVEGWQDLSWVGSRDPSDKLPLELLAFLLLSRVTRTSVLESLSPKVARPWWPIIWGHATSAMAHGLPLKLSAYPMVAKGHPCSPFLPFFSF